MKLKPVTSGNIKAVGHDPDTLELQVKFHSGDTWSYANVPEGEYDSMVGASSVGAYFARHIKGRYQASKLI